MGLIVLIGIVICIVLLLCVPTYNKMVRYRNKVKEGLRLVDIHLKLRFDLIPNLVSTVKGYAKHEKEIFDNLIELRKKAVEASEEKEKLEYANEIVPNMKHVIAIAENYPELKADTLFKSLMDELIFYTQGEYFYGCELSILSPASEVSDDAIMKVFKFMAMLCVVGGLFSVSIVFLAVLFFNKKCVCFRGDFIK